MDGQYLGLLREEGDLQEGVGRTLRPGDLAEPLRELLEARLQGQAHHVVVQGRLEVQRDDARGRDFVRRLDEALGVAREGVPHRHLAGRDGRVVLVRHLQLRGKRMGESAEVRSSSSPQEAPINNNLLETFITTDPSNQTRFLYCDCAPRRPHYSTVTLASTHIGGVLEAGLKAIRGADERHAVRVAVHSHVRGGVLHAPRQLLLHVRRHLQLARVVALQSVAKTGHVSKWRREMGQKT